MAGALRPDAMTLVDAFAKGPGNRRRGADVTERLGVVVKPVNATDIARGLWGRASPT